MKRTTLFIGMLTILFGMETFAKHVNENTAKQVGQSFFSNATSFTISKSSGDFELVYKSEAANSNTTQKSNQQTTFFYVFSTGTSGFVIVSGDDNVIPILGYSEEGTFDPNNMPPNVAKWLEEYKSQIRYVIDNNIQATQEIQEAWNTYLSGSVQKSHKATTSVSPLIQTKWDQSSYYNTLCPLDNSGYRTVTGCVATAMAQIMKFWNFPTTGSGFHSYNHQTYGTLSANFGSTTYNWANMPNQVISSSTTTQKNAVATLMYHCGVSVDMNYGTSSSGGSGAYVVTAASPKQHCSEYAFKTYFGYKNTLKGLLRSSYTKSQWVSLLKTELDAGRPVLYTGYGTGGGHAFVCDGYDNNDYFHFNWGWSGYYDGYFSIDALNPAGTGTGGGTGGFNSGHQALVGIEPPSGGGGGGGTLPLDLRLLSYINVPTTNVMFTKSFTATVNVKNFGTENFSGKLAVAIFDKNGNFFCFMDSTTSSLSVSSNYNYTFNKSGSAALVPGTYYLSLFYKTNEVDWTIVGDGTYANLTQFEIYYSADIEVYSDFSIRGGKLIQGQTADVSVNIANTGSNTFNGDFYLSLSTLDGTTGGQTIQILTGKSLQYNKYSVNNFSGKITVMPGTYLMHIAYKRNGETGLYYAGSSYAQNPIYVTVQAPPILPDQYEVNDTVSQAYDLPLTFSDDMAIQNTTGSNFHVGTDKDYYKIVLPSGYDYTITARLHDMYKSGNGTTYTADALFSYSKDGSTWSDTYDDVMTENISVQNGGMVYFYVTPYFSGETGTYLLDMIISRTATTSIENINLVNSITIYPNPANDFITIDLNECAYKVNSFTIINAQGQQLATFNIAEDEKNFQCSLHGYSNGIYFIQLHSTKGILTKKIVISR